MCAISFSERLNALLAERDINQAKLCELTGISSAQANYLALGKTRDPKLSTVCKIAIALDVSIDYLAGLIDEPRPIDWTEVGQPVAIGSDTPVTRELGNALNQLNETGIQEATKRVQEMTLVPAYVGKGKNGGDSDVQEVM